MVTLEAALAHNLMIAHWKFRFPEKVALPADWACLISFLHTINDSLFFGQTFEMLGEQLNDKIGS